ncbi:Protein JASON [Striga hermonthica]|uniref:Protein JASON n=1 Tax=Striga hermonthica TaxID=68872 RepID=A0A9N7NSR2_STRHE|nr:Protein JASON [Striga hermonthica]
MVRPWFSGEKEKGEGFAVVGFMRGVAAAVMGCFLGCFRAKNTRSHVSASQKRPTGHDEHALSALLLSDDDSLRNRGKNRKLVTEDADARELKNEAMFLKACGTLPETPPEIRKASGKWVDSSSNEEQSLNFNSWLPTASIEKLKLENPLDEYPPLVKFSEECVVETSSLVDSPSSCMTDGHNTRRSSIISTQSSDVQIVITPTDVPDKGTHSPPILTISPVAFATSARGKNKSVRFECDRDSSTFSSESYSERSKSSGSSGYSSESKPSPYPTPLKLSDEMQTPGTVFPAYSNNMADGKTNRIRSQYVYSVLNPIDNHSLWKDLKNDDCDADGSGESVKIKDEEPLISAPVPTTPTNELSFGEDRKHEGGFSGSNQHSDNQNGDYDIIGENVRIERTHGDRPILGMVATHWNENSDSHVSPKWWGGNGIPNSTTKYKEDQKVSWHATPFEERLEKVLSEENFVSQRKRTFGGTPPVEFHETEEFDDASSPEEETYPHL